MGLAPTSAVLIRRAPRLFPNGNMQSCCPVFGDPEEPLQNQGIGRGYSPEELFLVGTHDGAGPLVGSGIRTGAHGRACWRRFA